VTVCLGCCAAHHCFFLSLHQDGVRRSSWLCSLVQIFIKTSFSQLHMHGIDYWIESPEGKLCEGSLDFFKCYSFKRGEPKPFHIEAVGRTNAIITGEVVFENVPVFFQVWQRACVVPGCAPAPSSSPPLCVITGRCARVGTRTVASRTARTSCRTGR
jgi:hypothetical protein